MVMALGLVIKMQRMLDRLSFTADLLLTSAGSGHLCWVQYYTRT